MVDELTEEREPREQYRAGVQMASSGTAWSSTMVLARFVSSSSLGANAGNCLNMRPEPTLGQPVLARQEHAPELDAVQAGQFRAACAAVGSWPPTTAPADTAAAPSEELSARKVTVVPVRPSIAIVRIHNPLSPVIKRALRGGYFNGDISAR